MTIDSTEASELILCRSPTDPEIAVELSVLADYVGFVHMIASIRSDIFRAVDIWIVD
jgi:hypothetical protein